jgi:uncharacterized protein (UPF0264 family)
MTGLLVSVRNAAEAEVALQCNVQVLDVKEPARGSLGRADDRVLAEVVAAVAGRRLLSAALGELADEGSGFRVQSSEGGFSFLKIGLAGCGTWPDWPERWGELLAQLPHEASRVAVSYADWQAANAPRPEEILRHGHRLGCRAALIDTFAKNRGGLFEHLSKAAVANWISAARRLGMLAVVAGSLDQTTARQAAELGPDLIAVRGAACRGGRTNPLDRRLIESLSEVLATNS